MLQSSDFDKSSSGCDLVFPACNGNWLIFGAPANIQRAFLNFFLSTLYFFGYHNQYALRFNSRVYAFWTNKLRLTLILGRSAVFCL